jgi:ParB family chromosome partitioning protein
MKTPDEKDTTAAVEAVELWDTGLVLVSEKNTRQPTPKEVKELVESIRATGQITPAIARPHPTKEGHLELAAGARRRTACDVLKIS